MTDIEYAGKMAVVTGWGRVNETGNISPILRQVDVPIYTNLECHKTKYGAAAITENMMCAGYDEGQLDACQGDSGGPLHLEGKDRKIDLIGKQQNISFFTLMILNCVNRCRIMGTRMRKGRIPWRVYADRPLLEMDRGKYSGCLLLWQANG